MAYSKRHGFSVIIGRPACLVGGDEIELSGYRPCTARSGATGGMLMKLELTIEEVRVLDAAIEYIKKHKDVAVKIYAGYEEDMKTVNAVGGTLRAAYLHEKQKS
jgi:hypothetical protein